MPDRCGTSGGRNRAGGIRSGACDLCPSGATRTGSRRHPRVHPRRGAARRARRTWDLRPGGGLRSRSLLAGGARGGGSAATRPTAGPAGRAAGRSRRSAAEGRVARMRLSAVTVTAALSGGSLVPVGGGALAAGLPAAAVPASALATLAAISGALYAVRAVLALVALSLYFAIRDRVYLALLAF